MRAFYFGDPARPLFGALHEPASPPAQARVAVLCPPLWHEGVLAHRALRQLGVRLAGDGFWALRFDYSGTGDSAGDTQEGDVAQWLTDIATAVDEGKRLKSVDRVTLVGLRLGASLAALAAADRTDVERLVLWEPILDGKKYLDVERAEHRAERHGYRVWRMMAAAASDDDGSEMKGFPIGESMARSVSAVDLTRLARTAPRALVVERDPASGGERLKGHLAALGARADYATVAEPEVWRPLTGEATASPRKTFECIATWLGRSTP